MGGAGGEGGAGGGEGGAGGSVGGEGGDAGGGGCDGGAGATQILKPPYVMEKSENQDSLLETMSSSPSGLCELQYCGPSQNHSGSLSSVPFPSGLRRIARQTGAHDQHKT